MEVHINTNQIHLLMNKNSLSESNRYIISQKIQNIINYISYLNTIKSTDETLNAELTAISLLLANEQKATAKIIVSKNNLLSKNLIKSMSTQKENLLQMIEINQLHLEAELKRLNQKLNYPVLRTESSFLTKLFNLFKIPFKNSTYTKNKGSIRLMREKIDLTTSKLNSLEKKKEDLAKELGYTGTDALRYLNKVTYNSFLPVYDTSNSHLENLKNKITFFDN